MSEKGEGLALNSNNGGNNNDSSVGSNNSAGNNVSNVSNVTSIESNNENSNNEQSLSLNIAANNQAPTTEQPLNNQPLNIAPNNQAPTTEQPLNAEQIVINKQPTKNQQVESKENSGVEISSKPSESDDDALYIGDKITIQSTKYGKVTGHIYYLNENEMLRIMPLGLSSVLIDFPFINGEFDPDIGILTDEEGNLDISRNKKGPRVGFVALRSFREGQTLEALTKSGEKIAEYTITAVNEDNDRIKVENNDTKDLQDIDFNFQGIPTDLPFAILRIARAKELPREEEKEEAPKPEVVEESDEIEEFDLATFTLIETIASEERMYPEVAQKSDFLTDLLYDVPTASQKNPKIIRRIRGLVELFSSLKNSVVKRKIDGSIEGEELLSVVTMNDLLLNRTVPIVRPVLETMRILATEADDQESATNQVLVRKLKNIVIGSTDFLKRQGDIQPGDGGIPRWYQALLNYFTNYPTGDKYSGGDFTFSEDGDYFRREAPSVNGLEGLIILADQFEDLKSFRKYMGQNIVDYVGKIKQSLRRGHGPTMRPKEKGGTHIYIPADQTNVKGYVLFPYRAVTSGFMGAIRTGNLWDACVRGKAEPISMEKILEELGGISDVKDANSILYLDSTQPLLSHFQNI